MKIYLVGGAIRDALLQLPVTEKDWVVVGSTPEAMIDAGYQPVGKDFPVFLHPKTKEEYALARTEKKTAKGYKGFQFYTSPDVTLEEDLKRRDLTINAMAQDDHGNIIDPYHGQDDLNHQLLKHVSPAFSEDPVRLLRIARFASKLPEFRIHPDTLQLMQTMVNAGEVDALIAERVWKEFDKALGLKAPWRFIDCLTSCQAWDRLFPEVSLTQQQRNDFQQHALTHTNADQRFALLLSHSNEQAITTLAQRYRVPNHYRDLAILLTRHANNYHTLALNDATALLTLFKDTDALRKPDRFMVFTQLADSLSPRAKKRSEFCHTALQQLQALSTQAIQQSGVKGLAFAKAVHNQQLETLKQWIDPS